MAQRNYIYNIRLNLKIEFSSAAFVVQDIILGFCRVMSTKQWSPRIMMTSQGGLVSILMLGLMRTYCNFCKERIPRINIGDSKLFLLQYSITGNNNWNYET